MNEKIKSSVDIPSAFFNELYTIAKNDQNVMLLSADQGAWALEKFKENLYGQFYNLGVSEQHLISVSAGLSLTEKKVFVYAITPFVMQRCLEQIKVDLCLSNIPVTIIGSGSTLTYSFHGPTHQAMDDIAIMRSLPNMTILNPCDEISAKAAVQLAYTNQGPTYVKMDKGFYPVLYTKQTRFADGIFQLKGGNNLCIIATGIMTQKAILLAEKLSCMSIDASIIDIYKIKPLNKELLLNKLKNVKCIVTIEEQTIIGGIGSAVCEVLSDYGINIPIMRFGINDEYCELYGDRDWLHKYYGLDIVTLSKKIERWLKVNKLLIQNRT